VLEVFGRKVGRSSRCSGKPSRWRVAVLALVIPGFLCASVVKLARSSSYKSQPIVCDGVDDDTDTFILCGLPDEVTKKSSLTKVRPLPGGMIPSPAILRPRVGQVRPHRIASLDSPRFQRLPMRRVSSSADPDDAH